MEVQRSHHLKPGTILNGRYETGPVLGEGGFGITYSGTDRNTGEKIAIKEFFCRDYMDRDVSGTKTLLTDDDSEHRFASERKRFLRESEIVGGFRDEPSIVTVLDYFEENGTAYIVMEYIEGETLSNYIRKNGKMDPEQMSAAIRPMLAALEKLHEGGVVHRDISPDNIMRRANGDLVLIDFGSAKNLNNKTLTTATTYKDGFTPPEQYKQGAKAAPSMDIYAICATMYYCLTGVMPQPSLQRILFDENRPLRDFSQVPEEITDMIDRGMSLRADERQQSLSDLITSIDKAFLTPEEKQRLKEEREKKIKLLIAAACILLAITTAGMLTIKGRTDYRDGVRKSLNEQMIAVRQMLSDQKTDIAETAEKQQILTSLESGTGGIVFPEYKNVIRVADKEEFSEALNNASSGTKIEVAPGKYAFDAPLSISKSNIAIAGTGDTRPEFNCGFNITGSDVMIDNISINIEDGNHAYERAQGLHFDGGKGYVRNTDVEMRYESENILYGILAYTPVSITGSYINVNHGINSNTAVGTNNTFSAYDNVFESNSVALNLLASQLDEASIQELLDNNTFKAATRIAMDKSY